VQPSSAQQSDEDIEHLLLADVLERLQLFIDRTTVAGRERPLAERGGKVVGDGGTIRHWDGSSWMIQVGPGASHLMAVSGTDRAVWAVGEKGSVLRLSR